MSDYRKQDCSVLCLQSQLCHRVYRSRPEQTNQSLFTFDQFLMETLEEANMRVVQSFCNLQPEHWMPLILVLEEAETVGVF